MAIPVISPATLEYFSLILGEAPLMISGDQNVTATAANPTGLRLAGGNLFRDFTPWAEHEINSWANGFGHSIVGSNGYFGSKEPSVNTVLDDLRLNRSPQVVDSLTISKPTNVDWTTDPFVESEFVRANDGNYYAYRGFQIYKYDTVNDDWDSGTPWFDVRDTLFDDDGTDPQYQDFYIIDMCEFDEYLIIVTRPRFRVTGTHTGEFFIAQGAAPPAFYSMPNVFAIRTRDAFPFVVGDQDFFHLMLPLPAFGGIPVGPNWASASARIRSILCATAVHQYGGYLFIGGSAGFAYTSGETVAGGSGPPWWQLEEYVIHGQAEYGVAAGAPIVLKTPYSVSTKYGGDNWVTGFAGIQGQTVGDFSVYMSTSKSLFMLDLNVPIAVKVMDYSGVNVRNGKGMMAHQNDIYIPVGNGLFRFTQQGQTVPLGVDQVPESPIYSNGTGEFVNAQHFSLVSTPGTLVSSTLRKYSTGVAVSNGYIMALKGQGWHQLAEIVGALYYRQDLLYFFIMQADLRSAANWNTNISRLYFADNDPDEWLLGEGDGWRTTGYIDLGFYSAESPLLDKDWQSISLFGRCIGGAGGGSKATVYYRLLDAPVDCDWTLDMTAGTEWTELGTLESGNSAEFIIPDTNNCSTGRASKWIALRIFLEGDQTGSVGAYATATPIIEGVKIKYFAPILDYFRFSFATTLPKDCLTDGCGNLLTEYSQEEWDAEIRAAVCNIEPVKFRDVDGQWYEVRVESASRRIEKVNYSDTGRTWDISWSLVLVQVNSDTICDPLWSPPVCP